MAEPELFAAMAKAFPKIEGALKDSENAAFKQGGRVSKYADLSSVVDAIKPALIENDLFFAQLTHEQTGGVCIETVVGHKSGGMFSFGKLFVPASKSDAHGYGSALTYARRYSLMAAFGVCPEDDDGNAATANPPRQQDMPQQQGRQQPPPLKGPIKTRAALKDACTEFVRELHACGDSDQLEAFLQSSKALTDQVEEEHQFFWNGDGMEFLGLAKEIAAAQLRVQDDSWKSDPLRAG